MRIRPFWLILALLSDFWSFGGWGLPGLDFGGLKDGGVSGDAVFNIDAFLVSPGCLQTSFGVVGSV